MTNNYLNRYHYWICKNKQILNLFENITSQNSYTVERYKYLYQEISKENTNRNINIFENKIISQIKIPQIYNCIDISEKCRLLYNNVITLLEIDGKSITSAREIFQSLVNDKNGNVFLYIDDNIIQSE